MIFSLEGILRFKSFHYIVVETGGVGYRIFVGPQTMKALPLQDENVKVYTSLYQRENEIELYGFAAIAEMEFFETLINISGIGPKSALGILSVAPLDTLKKAIAAGQANYLTKVSGIGRKTAEKIILELKDKLGDGKGGEMFGEDEEVLAALQALGYSLKEAREAIHRIPENARGSEERIKSALKAVSKNFKLK
ncbi:MAG: Holliday junction branch migration protein RuvA [Candidatus Niyogibacteria bacterium]|nr:Holliday junction branch migration protein RuvA [Candidatus Niyogibacteria bacterium]